MRFLILFQGRGEAIRLGEMRGRDSLELSLRADLLITLPPSVMCLTGLLRLLTGGGGNTPSGLGSYS